MTAGPTKTASEMVADARRRVENLTPAMVADVHHILTKLDCRSRVDVARRVTEIGRSA
jgi:hypothetical protein